MNAIRENLFLVALVAAVLVVGGILLAVRSHYAGELDAQVDARKALSDRGSQFRGQGNLVNERIVAAEANRGRLIVEEANRVAEFQVRLNQPAYPVLKLPLMDGDRVRGEANAFPYDPAVYKNEALTFQFIRRHPAEIARRLQALQPTRVPTEREIDGQLASLLAREGAAAPGAGAGGWPAPGAGPAADAAGLNRKKAQDFAVFQKAIRGRIYVDEAVTLENTFKPSETVASELDLWRKQVGLWILTDVTAAVQAANDEALDPNRMPARDRNVCNSAVKRWVSLTVRGTYSAGAEPAGGAGAAGGGAAAWDQPSPPLGGRPSAPPPDGGGYGPGGGGYGPGGGDYGPGAGGYGPGGGMFAQPEMPAPVQVTAETCTRHYTDTEKDVVQYTFQVAMPTRHIPLLMRKLTQGRLHTVVALRAEEAPQDPRYYYSNDPVMLVTFTCEAIFLTSWERDLVPPEFLKKHVPSSALREKDKARLPKP